MSEARSRPGVADLVSGAVTVAFGAGVIGYARTFPRLDGGAPGPALFPSIVGGLLVLFGAVLVGRWSLARLRARDAGRAQVERAPVRAFVDAAVVVLAVVFYLLVADILGFAPTMAIALFVLSWRLGAKLLVAIGTAVVVPALIYVVFQRVLLVPLPAGPFG